MRARLSPAFATTLPLLLCLMSNVESASKHRHQQQHHQSDNSVQTHSSPSSSSSSSERTSHEKSSTITYHASTNNNRLKHKSPQTITDTLNNMRSMFADKSENESPGLMREYMSRSLFQCSADYLIVIEKLNEMIKWAHAEYEKCAELMVKAPKKYDDTPFAALNDLLKEWKEEDMADEDNDSSSSIEIENVEELKRPQRIKVL